MKKNISILLSSQKSAGFCYEVPANPKQPKLLMQNYYRLRLISMKGCHLLISYNFLSTCRTYHTPHNYSIRPWTMLRKSSYGGGGGICTLVQSTYHNCRQRLILIMSYLDMTNQMTCITYNFLNQMVPLLLTLIGLLPH